MPYWKDTVLIITWDDWGGFFDHVQPPAVWTWSGTGGYGNWTCPQIPNGWGCGYVYGFRVPLLVVSAYTPAGTVSGKLTGKPKYPPDPCWTHDFGSILAFTENNFYQQGLYLQYIYKPLYADYNTLDAVYAKQAVVPLWDFFLAYPTPRPFTYISPILSTDTASFFENYYQAQQAQPLGPEEIAPGVEDPDD